MNYLICYRSTPHSVTGISPAEALFRRQLRTKLPELRNRNRLDEEMRDRDRVLKMKGKEYSDKCRHVVNSDVNVGDEVLVPQQKHDKLSTTYSPVPCTVVGRNGNSVTVRTPEGIDYKRNVTQVKQIITRSSSVDTDFIIRMLYKYSY